MNIRFIKTPEKRKIIEELENNFGVKDIKYLLFETGKEKIRAFSGSLSKEEMSDLGLLVNIEIIGLYLIKREHDLRFNIDALHLLKDQITKNIIDIDEEQFQHWIRGHDLEIKVPQGTYVIRHKGDLLGCGKSNGEKIFNYVPKDRRLKKN